MLEALREAGWPAYVVIAFGAVSSLLALAAAVTAVGGRERSGAIGLSIGALGGGVLTAGMGALGYAIQMRGAFEAVSYADPSARASLLAAGISEAMNNIVFGGVCAAPGFLLGFGALVVVLMRGSGTARARGD